MKYNFSEKKFGDDFCKSIYNEVSSLINAGLSFTMLGMPNVGMDTFLRFLSIKDFSYFVYLDIPFLENKTEDEFFLTLYKELEGKGNITAFEAHHACRKQIRKLLLSHKQVVILLSRFDFLKDEEDLYTLDDLKEKYK